MDKEIKTINSEIIKTFIDFLSSVKFNEELINENQDDDEYEIDYWFLEKNLKSVLLDLMIEENTIRKVKSRKLGNGEYFEFGHSKLMLYVIEWIKENLDVWEITEKEYDSKNKYRQFEFKIKE